MLVYECRHMDATGLEVRDMSAEGLDIAKWRRDAESVVRSFKRGYDSDAGLSLAELSDQVCECVTRVYGELDPDDAYHAKLVGAASEPWSIDGAAAPVIQYEQLVGLLSGTSQAGGMLEMGIDPAVDFARSMRDEIVVVVGGFDAVLPDAWFELNHADRVIAVRQAVSIALIDLNLPRTGVFDAITPEEIAQYKLSKEN